MTRPRAAMFAVSIVALLITAGTLYLAALAVVLLFVGGGSHKHPPINPAVDEADAWDDIVARLEADD